jgi:hypothetical protein
VPRVAGLLVTAVALSLALSGCLDDRSVEMDPGTIAPVGPEPAPSGALTLEKVMAIVGESDGGDNTVFTAGAELSTSGDDLLAENEYFSGNKGKPAECAPVVSSPYLVSSLDTGARADDPSYLVGTYSEVDEQRFGLIQVYARQFDDAATASGFLREVRDAVAACPGYRLYDGDTVTLDVTKLKVASLSGLPDDIAGLRYIETLKSSASDGVTIDFLQKDAIVISVYGETTPSSTITQEQIDGISADVVLRLDVL